MNDLAEAASLALSFPTIIAGLGVLVHWGKGAWEAITTTPALRTAVQWLVLGVYVGFLGDVLDNAYWFFAWSAEFANHPSRDWWFSNGAWPNIPFRQGAGIYAAYCHMRSYYSAMKEGKWKLQLIILGSFALGIIYVLFMTWLRSLS